MVSQIHLFDAFQSKDDEYISDDSSASDFTNGDVITEEIDSILEKCNELASDQVGCVYILDLSSPTVFSILKEKTTGYEFESIKSAASIMAIVLTEYASRLVKNITDVHFTAREIKRALIKFEYENEIDPIIHHDAQFIIRTITHFADMISSPSNPLCTNILERTAAVYSTIYIIDQMFISNNDIIELAWLEREYVPVGLVEFSGGSNDKTTTIKESYDIEKLYTKILKVNNETDPIPKTMYCFIANVMYFEKLSEYGGSLIRNIVTSFIVPTAPRLLKKYVQQVPDLLA